MALKELSCEIIQGKKKKTLLFDSANVDKKDVYSLKILDEKGEYECHVGYMTKKMAEKLLSLDNNGKRFIDRVLFTGGSNSRGEDSSVYGQKIVLDLPDNIDDPTFATGFVFRPCTYASKRAEPLFLKVHNVFNYSSRIGNVVLVPNGENNHYEIDSFFVSNQEGREQEIILDICKNKAKELFIGINSNSEEPSNGVKYKITTTETNASINIAKCKIPTRSSDLNQYINFVGGKGIYLNNLNFVSDDINVLDLNEVTLAAKGELKLEYSTITLDDDNDDLSEGCGICSDGDVSFVNANAKFTGVTRVEGDLKLLYSNSIERTEVNFERSNFYSDFIMESNKEKSKFTLLHANIANGNEEVRLKDSAWISETLISNSGENPLCLTNFYSQFSVLKNISDISNADIGFTEADNLVIKNDASSDKRTIIICPEQYYDNLAEYVNNGITGEKVNQLNNCVINITDGNRFYLGANTSVDASNCVFTNSDIDTSINDDDLKNKLVLENSVFKDADLYLSFSNKEDKDTDCIISLSEINGKFSAKDLSKIERTVTSGNVFLGNASEVKDCYLQDCTLSYKKPMVVENYNSNANDEMNASNKEDSLSYTPL